MLQKYKKVLIGFAIIVNLLGWISLAGAMQISNELIFISMLCYVVSFLIAFPILLSFIGSKLTLREKRN